jgi:GT2 family glycosyltransferase
VSSTVSIVIVNYNGAELLGPCLDSVLSQTRPFDEIIVVDNASTDSTVQFIERTFPGVHLIASRENLGYAEGCNRGILAASGELVAILNNDVVLDPDWLEHLLQYNRDPWSFWASLVAFASDPGRVDSAGDGMAVVGAGFKIGHGKKTCNYGVPAEVFGPCGAAALYRRSLLEATGGFDPDFFLVYEDADLNFRARLLGFRCLYVPQAVAYHGVNSNIGTFSHNYVFYGHRNSEYVFWKNLPLRLLLSYLPERILFDVACFLFFLYRKRGASFLHAKLDFIRNLPSVLRKRRRIQQARHLSAPEVRAVLTRNWFRHRLKDGASS